MNHEFLAELFTGLAKASANHKHEPQVPSAIPFKTREAAELAQKLVCELKFLADMHYESTLKFNTLYVKAVSPTNGN